MKYYLIPICSSRAARYFPTVKSAMISVPSSLVRDRSGRCVDRDDVDELFVDELVDAEVGELMAVAGDLDTAERQVRLEPSRVVDVHHSGVDAIGDLDAMLDVAGEHRSAQPEARVVGKPHGFVLILDPEEQRHRAEELLVVGRVVRAEVG